MNNILYAGHSRPMSFCRTKKNSGAGGFIIKRLERTKEGYIEFSFLGKTFKQREETFNRTFERIERETN